MKSKIFKIMGVTLALVLTFTVGAAFLPANTVDKAEAATLAWSGIDIPSGVGNVLVGQDENLGPVAISPNYASDSTVFAVVNDVSTPNYPVVYKSTNGGHTWTATTTNLGATGDMGIALMVSPQYATDNTVFVAVQTPDSGGSGTGIVYRSTNGNISYGQLGVVTLVGTEIITSMDVSPDYDGVGVLAIGIADRYALSAAASARCLQLWGYGDVLSWTALTTSIPSNLDISAVKFSPSYAVDSTILTVASAANARPYLRPVVGGVWSSSLATDIGATAVLDLSRNNGDTDHLNYASIAVPADYNATVPTMMRVYVSIVADAAVVDTNSNVYRVTGTTTGAEIATDMAKRLYPIDYNGTFAEGTLIGALWEDTANTAADVYRTTNPASAVVDWYGVTGDVNKPTGTSAVTSGNITYPAISGWVKMSATYADDSMVIVGTQGEDSAFGVSIDGGISFNEYGLIDNDNTSTGIGGELALTTLSDVRLSPDFANDNTIFLVTENDNAVNNNSNVWMSTDGGVYWERAFTANWTSAGAGIVAFSSEYATDSVVYVGETGALGIWYTANVGKTWSARTVANLTGIQTVAAPDATTVYVGDSASGNVGKSTNSGWTWPASLVSNSGATGAVVSLKVKESTVVAGGTAGTVRRSDDSGATWALVGAGGLTAANVFVDFDGTTVYAVESGTGNVFRSVDGSAWIEIAAATTSDTAAVELILAPDGTLYTAEDDTTLGWEVMRSIDPTAAVPSPDATFQNMPTLPDVALTVMSVASAGSSNVVAIINGTPTVRIFTDTLSAGIAPLVLDFPADDSYLDTLYAVFGIEAIPGATAYEVWWATDPAITSRVTPLTITAPAVQVGGTVTEGYTIYWMARATAPFNSPWSEVWSFHTALVTAVAAPSLVSPGSSAGSTVDVPLEPVLNWSAFKYASGYEMQLAKDSGMTDFIANMTGANALGNVTSWKCTTTLAYSTTYFWRVRAIMGTAATYSDWSNVVGFTTMAKPVAPTPPVIIEPTPVPVPVEPTTPAYIWGIIAIGAVLVIVVIVLIVRTRRTP